MKKQKIALALVLSLVLMLGMTACGGSKPFPSQEINLVVPFGSGGSTDLLARALAQSAGEKLGKNVIVTNVTGASGTVGTAQLAASDPDGYNIEFVTSAPITIQPYFMEGLTYTYENFDYICNVASEPTCIAVQASSPYQTLEDLVNAGRNGTTISFGNTGVGTIHYLFQDAFGKAAGIDYKLVGFEGGAKLVTGLLGGNVDAMSTVVSEMYDHVTSGEIRILAVSTAERSPLYPDIPTLKELDYDLVMSLDFFLVAPKGLPEDIKATLTETFKSAAESKLVTDYLTNGNVAGNYMDGAALAEKIAADSATYQALLG